MRTLRHATNPLRCVCALCCALFAGAAPAPASARPALIITGAGLGHGIGMSQYGADGFARHGFDYTQILAHYYAATTLGPMTGSPQVRVLLATRSTASFSGATRAGGHVLARARHYSALVAGARVTLVSSTGRTVGSFTAPLHVSGPGPLRVYGTAQNGIRDGRYRGTLELSPAGARVQIVDALDIESYVRGVVGAESPPSWPAAALEAQAVAARTYAITATVPGHGYTQYADTRSQEYHGVSAETKPTDAAVAATAGQVVTYLGKPVATYFFSSSGGETDDIQNVFLGNNPDPWLTAVDDPYDAVSPDHRWGPIDLSMSQVEHRLGGLIKGRFRGIHVTQRGTSPRIVAAQVMGSGGATDVTGPELQARFGLDDTWAYFSTTGRPVTVPTPVSPGPVPTPVPTPTDTTPGAPTPTPPTTTTTPGSGPPGGVPVP
jgi:stage II sporulation protein D